MRIIPVGQIKSGQKLGQTLYNIRMLPALRPGIILEKNHIRWLAENGYRSVMVDDGIQIEEPKEIISEEQFLRGTRVIKELFTVAESVMRMESGDTSSKTRELFLLRNHRDELLEGLLDWGGRLIVDMSKNGYRLWERSVVKSQETYALSHALCTALISILIGFKMKLNFKQLQALFAGSILAEIGNLTIPKAVLDKQGRLSEEEFELVKSHCYKGYIQIKSCAELNHLIKIICLEHHERVDGMGYPKGLKRENIHLLARIMAVSDAYDAMNSDRPYRYAYMPHKALEILRMSTGFRYDEEVFSALVSVVLPYPVGTLVSLDDGSCGVVSGIKEGIPDDPLIRLFNGNELCEPIPLSDLPGRRIAGIRHAIPGSEAMSSALED